MQYFTCTIVLLPLNYCVMIIKKTKETEMKIITKTQINKMSYYIHPNLPNHKIYTDSINKIPARKNIDKSKYILINKGK